MTENRFSMFKSKFTGLWIIADKHQFYHFPGFKDEFDCMRFVNALNDLEQRGTLNGQLASKYLEENEQLKQEIRNLRDFRGFITEKNVSNDKERKELQMQMLRLYNYFENYFEYEMSPNAFSEMWDNVKEDEKWEKR